MTTTFDSSLAPLIIDNGSGTVKAGYATTDGQNGPTVTFPAIIGRPRHKTLGQIGGRKDAIYVGNDAEAKRGILKVSYPIEKGYIKNMHDTYLCWLEALRKIPGATESIQERGLLLTEPPLNSHKNREQTVEIAIEKLHAKGVSLQVQGVLSLYSYGKITGTIVELGDGISHTIPIFDGFCLPHAVNRLDLGGRDITTSLGRMLSEETSTRLTSSAEFEILRNIKEQYCKVSQNFDQDIEEKKGYSDEVHTLPDGKVITLKSQQIRAPECLFDPSMIGLDEMGIHEMIVDTINKSDIDLRKDFNENIYLGGGSSTFPGLETRLEKEVQSKTPSTQKVCVTSGQHRKNAVFIGAAMVASLPTFDHTMYITKQELEEYGSDIVHRKCF